jgi:hypothetical protein
MSGIVKEDKLSMVRDKTIPVSNVMLLLLVDSRGIRSYLSILLDKGGLWFK